MDSQLFSKGSQVPIKGARLADWYRDEVAQIFQHQFPGKLLSVTRVTLSPDSRVASIWFRSYPLADSEQYLGQLKKMHGRIQSKLNARLSRRFAPSIEFVIDTREEDEARLQSLLQF